MTPAITTAMQRVGGARHEAIELARHHYEEADADLALRAEREQLSVEQYSAWIGLALMRISYGHGLKAGVGVDLAEATMILRLFREHEASPDIYASIEDLIVAFARRVRQLPRREGQS